MFVDFLLYIADLGGNVLERILEVGVLYLQLWKRISIRLESFAK